MYGLLQRTGAAVTGNPCYRPGDLTRSAVAVPWVVVWQPQLRAWRTRPGHANTSSGT